VDGTFTGGVGQTHMCTQQYDDVMPSEIV